MKKYCLITFGLIALSLFAKAQYCKNEIGIEAGPGLSDLVNGDYLGTRHTSTPGYCISLFYQHNFNSILSFRTGLQNERKGASITDYDYYSGAPKVGYESKLHTYFTTLPLILRLNFGNTFQFFFNIGASGSVRTAVGQEDYINGALVHQSKYSFRQGLELWPDVSFLFGFGGTYRFHNRLGASLEVRKITSFIPISYEGSLDRTYVLLAGLSWKLRIK